MELGQRVKAARAHAKLTQTQLAERVGITQQTLSDLERGQNETSSKLPDIAFTCGVEPLWLVREEGPMVRTAPEPVVDNSPDETLLALTALVDFVSARAPSEAKALIGRLAAAREQYEAHGLLAPLLRNLEGVAADASHARKRVHPRGKRQ